MMAWCEVVRVGEWQVVEPLLPDYVPAVLRCRYHGRLQSVRSEEMRCDRSQSSACDTGLGRVQW
jgi:hypothetical protein